MEDGRTAETYRHIQHKDWIFFSSKDIFLVCSIDLGIGYLWVGIGVVLGAGNSLLGRLDLVRWGLAPQICRGWR